MKVRVRLFASYREAAGREWLEEDLPAGARVRDLLVSLSRRHGLAGAPGRALVARRMEYVGHDAPLQEGDEVAVLPPLSGGSGSLLVRLMEEPIDIPALIAEVSHPACGALAMFLGVVREPNLGHRTLAIDYHAYSEMAEQVMAEIASEAAARWEVERIAVVHRLGRLRVGEASVAILVSAPHRRAGLEAASYLIEELKARVPIWKKEHFEGGEVWIEGDAAAAPSPPRTPSRGPGGAPRG